MPACHPARYYRSTPPHDMGEPSWPDGLLRNGVDPLAARRALYRRRLEQMRRLERAREMLLGEA